jgi:hypothetical protein
MSKKKVSAKDQENYLAFLKKRIESKHFKENVTQEEFDKTKAKYEKEKFKARILKGL